MTRDRLPTPMPIAAAAGRVSGIIDRHGVEAASEEELLATVLGERGPQPRIARRLIDRFGSLGAVTRAHPVELRLAGLSAAAAPAGRGLHGGRPARRADFPAQPWVIRSPTDAAEPLVDAMASLDREELRVLILDTKNVVTAERTVYRGNLAGSSVRVGEVFRDAVRALRRGDHRRSQPSIGRRRSLGRGPADHHRTRRRPVGCSTLSCSTTS